MRNNSHHSERAEIKNSATAIKNYINFMIRMTIIQNNNIVMQNCSLERCAHRLFLAFKLLDT